VIGKLVNSRTNEEYELIESPTPIGRHAANAVKLRGFAVSRFHAEIGEDAPGKPYVEDMGSTYGTYVNGKKVEGHVRLADGDVILLGVSSGFPDGEYAFTFVKAAGASREEVKRTPARPSIHEGKAKFVDQGPAYVFRLDGVFRRHECDGLATAVLERVRREPKDVVINLAGVEYMNSYALGILVRLAQDVGAERRRVLLAGAQGLVLKLFQTVGLDKKLGSYPTEEEALEELGG
jgi:anti-sigma B factor antagonist